MIETGLINAIKDFLLKGSLEKSQLRVQAKIHVTYALTVGKETLHVGDEEHIKELYHAITGKTWTRDIKMERDDYDS